jgi:plasmid stabilization system protein ParE
VKISLSAQAELELVEGATYYAREANRELGEAFIAEFDRCARLLGEYPKLGAMWRGRVRRFPLRRFPYSIVYDLRESEVRVLAIAHQRRRPDFWRGRT